MRKLVLAAILVCLSASASMAQMRNCAPIRSLKAKLDCVEANQRQLVATVAALMNGVQIRSQVGGDMANGNPWCLMIRNGANATVARDCVIQPGEYASVRWQLVPVP